MVRGLLEKRRGALPPILTALITIAAIVSAALVSWFMFTTTSSAVRQPVLQVTDAYYVAGAGGTGGNLFLTIRNLGAVDVTISSVTVSCASTGNPSFSTQPAYNPSTKALPRGGSLVVQIPVTSGKLSDGDSCNAVVTYTNTATGAQATDNLGFRVVVP
jgi:hypothetical protein